MLFSVRKTWIYGTLISHSSGKKHQDKSDKFESPAIESFFVHKTLKSNHSSSSSSAIGNSSSTCRTLGSCVIPESVILAEKIWVLRAHSSLRSYEEINKLFQVMFSDSKISDSFKLGKTKCRYFNKEPDQGSQLLTIFFLMRV